MTPRLLTEDEAREITGPVSPRKIMPPMRLGNRSVWDRKALERAIDKLSGIETVTPKGDDGDEWIKAQG